MTVKPAEHIPDFLQKAGLVGCLLMMQHTARSAHLIHVGHLLAFQRTSFVLPSRLVSRVVQGLHEQQGEGQQRVTPDPKAVDDPKAVEAALQ